MIALVLAGHLVGDWIVQTDAQAAGKTWPRPTSEWSAALLRVGVDHAHPDPAADQAHYATLWQRARSWRFNQAHMLGYHLTMLAAVAFGGLNATRVAVLLSISWVTHSFIDRRWPVRWLMRHTGSAAFAETSWGVMAVDQALHLSILCLLVAGLSA